MYDQRLADVEGEAEHLREEIDALRAFILSRAMSSEDYAAFLKIPSYAIPSSREQTGAKGQKDAPA